MNCNHALFRFLCILFIFSHSLCGQFLKAIHLFPDSHYVNTFIADAHAHKMGIETIELTRNLHASFGGSFSVFEFILANVPMQASFGGSVHFDLRPSGQTHIVSSEYYIDYFILDVFIKEKAIGDFSIASRFVSGHTSHHLSDTWIDDEQPPVAIHYARDYVRLFVVCAKQKEAKLYIGADYAYIFTIDRRIQKPWTFQAGGEAAFLSLTEKIVAYAAVDCKIKQEAAFTATTSYQAGIKMPMNHNRTFRIAYQFRHGLDERGQFFPQHRTLSTIGFYIEI